MSPPSVDALLEPSALVRGVLGRDKRSISTALSMVENRHPDAQAGIAELLEDLASSTARLSFRVGVTGPPGVGKSSLLSALVQQGLEQHASCAVVAVDPSSAVSGGAILGDRARMRLPPDEPLAFFRSLATQGHLGGLSAVVPGALAVLDPAFDFVFVETTGVGQTETEVSDYVDFVVVVVQPGSGDTLQFIKAGLMEIPDLLVVNKSDLGTIAERTAAELSHSLASLPRPVAAGVVSVSAETKDGVAQVWQALNQAARVSGVEARRARRARAEVLWATRELQAHYGQHAFEVLGPALEARVAGAVQSGQSVARIFIELGVEYLERVRSDDFTR